MLITVRCYLIPADVTFDLNDVHETYDQNNMTIVQFNNGQDIVVDRQHYLAEKAKIRRLNETN